jgi:hypothetical protein
MAAGRFSRTSRISAGESAVGVGVAEAVAVGVKVGCSVTVGDAVGVVVGLRVGEAVGGDVAVDDGVGVAVDPSSSPPQAANAGRSKAAKTRTSARLTLATEPSRRGRVNSGNRIPGATVVSPIEEELELAMRDRTWGVAPG